MLHGTIRRLDELTSRRPYLLSLVRVGRRAPYFVVTVRRAGELPPVTGWPTVDGPDEQIVRRAAEQMVEALQGQWKWVEPGTPACF